MNKNKENPIKNEEEVGNEFDNSIRKEAENIIKEEERLKEYHRRRGGRPKGSTDKLLNKDLLLKILSNMAKNKKKTYKVETQQAALKLYSELMGYNKNTGNTEGIILSIEFTLKDSNNKNSKQKNSNKNLENIEITKDVKDFLNDNTIDNNASTAPISTNSNNSNNSNNSTAPINEASAPIIKIEELFNNNNEEENILEENIFKDFKDFKDNL